MFAIVQPSWNTSSVTYRIAGDNSSVHAVLDALVANCSIVNSSDSIAPYTAGSSWPLPEQVIQYYRASSFMLSLDGYNNTAALASNAPSSNSSSAPGLEMPDTALPGGLNDTLLVCVNTTVGASVPLEEVSSSSHKLSDWEIALIAVAGFLALVGLLVCWVCWVKPCLGRLDKRREERRKKRWAEKAEKRRRREEAAATGKVRIVDSEGNVKKDAYDAERGREADKKHLLDPNASPSSSRSPSPSPTLPAYSYSPTYLARHSLSFEERTLAGDADGTSMLRREKTRKWGSRSPSPSPTSARSSFDGSTLAEDAASTKSGKKRWSHGARDSRSELLMPTPTEESHLGGGDRLEVPEGYR